MRQTYQQNLANAQQMMAQAMEGIPEGSYTGEEFLGLGSDADWVVTRKADGKLTPEQNRLLAFGAPLCVYNDDYVDSLESTTDAETLKVVTMVYGGLVNKNIVAGLQARGVNALGLTGADMNVIRSVKRPVKEVDYGFVGDVEKVDASLLADLIHKGVVPVMAPLTHDGQGNMLNTNADTIAGQTAKALSV
jgi:hypothetical protein